jgi:hypothetical protein
MKQNKYNLTKKYQILLRRFYNTNIKSQRASILLGIDKTGFKNHIDKYLIEGMTKENFGELWGLDHIVPIQLFDFDNVDDFSLCYNYNNIIPMFNSDNRLKGASVHFSLLKLDSMYTNVYTQKLKDKCHEEIMKTYMKYIIPLNKE